MVRPIHFTLFAVAFVIAISGISEARNNAPLQSTGADAVEQVAVTNDPEKFGAKGDGQADDTAAVNAYAASLRLQLLSGRPPRSFKLEAGRIYKVSGPIDLTGMDQFDLDLNGSSIINPTGGAYAVLDLLGSAQINLHNGRIICGTQQSPCINGIQMGRYTAKQPFNENSLSDLVVDGYFRQAALYNNSETLSATAIRLVNRYTGGDVAQSYGLIQDGVGHWPIVSSFVRPDIRAERAVSFNENTFNGMTIYNLGTGAAVWIAGAHRHKYRGYVQVRDGFPAVLLYFAEGAGGYVPLDMLEWDVHAEVAPTAEFQISGYESPTIIGLTYRDHLIQAHTMFRTAKEVRSVTLIGANLEMPQIWKHSTLVFDEPQKYTVDADILMLSKDAPSWNAPAVFTGRVRSDSELGWKFGKGVVTLETPTGTSVSAEPTSAYKVPH
jgi:hypothetical protein